MDFQKLLQGKSVNEIELICENWYQRLNRLKDKYGQPLVGIDNKKAEYIIIEMMQRMIALSHIYAQLQIPQLPNYKKGTL